MLLTNIPKRYRNAELLHKNKSQLKLIKALQGTNDLIVVGGVGVGKTCIISAFIIKARDARHEWEFIKEDELFEILIAQYSNNTKSRDEAIGAIQRLKSCNNLVIDDIGTMIWTDKQTVEINRIMSARYDNMVRTVLTTNNTVDELKAKIGDRVVSRLRGNHVEVIVVKGDDMRGVIDVVDIKKEKQIETPQENADSDKSISMIKDAANAARMKR